MAPARKRQAIPAMMNPPAMLVERPVVAPVIARLGVDCITALTTVAMVVVVWGAVVVGAVVVGAVVVGAVVVGDSVVGTVVVGGRVVVVEDTEAQLGMSTPTAPINIDGPLPRMMAL